MSTRESSCDVTAPKTHQPVGRCLERSQDGFVTVETALCLILLGVVLVMLGGLCAVGLTQVRYADAAAQIAREAARDDLAAMEQVVDTIPKAEVAVVTNDQTVHVSVSGQMRPWGSWMPSIAVRAEAEANREES